MFRIIYSVLLPFCLPFVLYWFRRRFQNVSRQTPFPFRTLTVIGLVLVIVFLFIFSTPDKAASNSIYIPPKFINGQIVPAHMEKPVHAD